MSHDAHDWEKAYRGGVAPSRIKRESDDVLAEKAEAIEQPATEKQCRTDGRCQYAIDYSMEGIGHCPDGKCAMPEVAPCQYCDGTGDVHALDGEWRGTCNCGAASQFEKAMHPLNCNHINQGSMDAAADAYEAEYTEAHGAENLILSSAYDDELENLRGLLGMCYSKLIKFGVETSDPMLMDEIKLELMK